MANKPIRKQIKYNQLGQVISEHDFADDMTLEEAKSLQRSYARELAAEKVDEQLGSKIEQQIMLATVCYLLCRSENNGGTLPAGLVATKDDLFAQVQPVVDIYNAVKTIISAINAIATTPHDVLDYDVENNVSWP